MRDFVELFRFRSELKGWMFYYGERGWQNFNLQQANLADGDKVLLLFPASVTPVIEGGMWSRHRVNTRVFLCRKSETSTVSSVAETDLQKYELRLREMTEDIDSFLNEFLNCQEGVEAVSLRYYHEVNQFSISADYVGVDITFDIW